MLNSLSNLTSFKHFGSSTCSIPLCLWPTQNWGLNLNMLKIQNVWNSSDTFAFILHQQRPVLVSAHGQNYFRWNLVNQNVAGNANCSALKTVIGVTKVANEIYLPYLKLCVRASMLILMYCMCKIGPKVRLNNKSWGLPQDTNKLIFTK